MTGISIKDLPPPDPGALEHSERLCLKIEKKIENAGGNIGFDEFMKTALFEPGLGYYSAGAEKIGKGGDFITAPEISNLFSQCLARQLAQVLEDLPGNAILEIGPGTGAMAVGLLRELECLGALPDKYLLLETSADLRERQQQCLRVELPHLYDRLTWLDTLPESPLTGVIIGNEVLDVLPVCRLIYVGEEFNELVVGYKNNKFIWRQQSLTGTKQELARKHISGSSTHYPEGYTTEINTSLETWLHSVADTLLQGIILFIDYGYPRQEYYHPQRVEGTLLCHYRHFAHSDPFFLPGLQDITASVDFTAVAEAAVNAGLQVQGYTTQAHFLIDCGIAEILQENDQDGVTGQLEKAHQAKLLTLPGEMGERFKVIALGRDISFPLMGFRQFDQRQRL